VFESAFDGESKLQILNGNYRIPELPKYSSSVMELIRDMLQASPDSRPDMHRGKKTTSQNDVFLSKLYAREH
jgi:hypothetical protein